MQEMLLYTSECNLKKKDTLVGVDSDTMERNIHHVNYQSAG